MRDGVALLAILARVRRRLRAIAALEGAAIGAALALGALACGLAVTRWRSGGLPSALLPLGLGAAGGLAGAGAVAGALRKIPLDRCARLVDATLGGHDRLLSALAFWRFNHDGNPGRVPKPSGAPPRLTPFMIAAIADASERGGAVAPRAAVPLRRPRATPAFAAAATLLAIVALAPFPARGSRMPATTVRAGAPATTATARVRLGGRALDPERDQAAAALLAARALGDAELGALARELAATVKDLAAQGLDQSDLLDRLADLQRRADDAAAEVTGLRQGLEQAGRALQGAPATRESGRALEAQDGPATEKTLNDLAADAAEAGAGERNRIAGTLDKAGERARAATGAPTNESQARSSSMTSPSRSRAGAGESTPLDQSSGLAPGADPRDQGNDPADERQRRLARDDPHAARPDRASSSRPPAPRERRLQRLARELGEAAAACRADPEACRRKLQRQARELPRMEDEARRLAPRQRLAEAVRQMRERMRREGNAGGGERAREERRFLRAARGENHEGAQSWDEDPGGTGRLLAEDPDGPSGEGDDSDDSAGDDPSGNDGWAQSGGGDGEAGGAASGSQKGDGDGDSEGGTGSGIGSQKGGDPLGERGAMTTRGRAREAQVRNGAGPTRSQVIQSAARRGFARSNYQDVYADYQAAVEESLDASAVPPGRRYIVKRYFQLIRPQSPRAPR